MPNSLRGKADGGSTSLVYRSDTGKLSLCPDCIECDYCGNDEPGCPDASCHTPSRISVVLNAALSSHHGTSCQTCGFSGSQWPIPGGVAPNDVFKAIEITDVTSTSAFTLLLDEDGDSFNHCSWINNDVGSITIRFCEECDGGNCSGINATATLALKAILLKNHVAPAWRFAIYADAPSTSVVDQDAWTNWVTASGFSEGPIIGFNQTQTASTDICAPTLTMNNGILAEQAGCENDDQSYIIFDEWDSTNVTATLEPCG